MKTLILSIFFSLLRANTLDPINFDFLDGNTLLIVYADGISRNLLQARKPVIQSFRKGGLEVRNLCNVIDCDYMISMGGRRTNSFRSSRCLLLNTDKPCVTKPMQSLEELIHESDYVNTLDLDGDGYAIIGDSKTEEAMVLLSKTGFKLALENGNVVNKISGL